MNKSGIICLVAFCLSLLVISPVMAKRPSVRKVSSRATSYDKEFTISAEKIDVRDLLAMAGKAAKINLLMSRDVRGNTDVELKNVPAMVAVKAIAVAHNLKIVEFNEEYKVYLVVRTGTEITPLRGKYSRGELVSVGVKDVDVRKPFRILAKAAGINLLFTKDIQGKININIADLPPFLAIKALAAVNSLVLNRFDAASKLYILSRKSISVHPE